MTGVRASLLGVAVLCAGLAGCGGSGAGEGGRSTTPPVDPVATAPPPEPSVLSLAAGRLGSGASWKLTWETVLGARGSLCVRLTGSTGETHECTRSSSTWFIGVTEAEGGRIVYATLPCGVDSVELRHAGAVLDTFRVIPSDDASLAVLESPGALAGVSFVALGRDGGELFVVERLEDDPGSRIPAIGC